MSEKYDKIIEDLAKAFSRSIMRIIDGKTLTNKQKLKELNKIGFYLEKAKELEVRKE